MYHFYDFFFLVFHTLLTVFNLLGWIWKATRKANLVMLTLTFGAWFGLGIFYGIGYCPLTDWHFQVLSVLGETHLPDSYITYILNRLLGISIPEGVVEIWTVVLFFTAFALSIWLNFRQRFKIFFQKSDD
jgi:hypothetical protein